VVAAARDGARASPLAAPHGAAHAAGTDPRIDGAAIAGLIVLLASPAVLPPVSILVGVLLVARSRAWTVWRKVLGVTAPVALAGLLSRPRRPPVADGRRAPGGVAMDG
jgi:hypothetical protein